MFEKEFLDRKLFSHEVEFSDYAWQQSVPAEFLETVVKLGIHPEPRYVGKDGGRIFDLHDTDNYESFRGGDDEEQYTYEDLQDELEKALDPMRIIGGRTSILNAVVDGLLPEPIGLENCSPSKPTFDRNEVDALMRDEETVNDLRDFFK